MQCPNCKLINPPIAQLCDCGYDFDHRVLTPGVPPSPAPIHAGWRIVCFSLPIFLGLVSWLFLFFACLIAVIVHNRYKREFPNQVSEAFIAFNHGVGTYLGILLIFLIFMNYFSAFDAFFPWGK